MIYIEYRLIPEYKYPNALVDSMLATKYLINNADLYNIDLKNLILVGDSAGKWLIVFDFIIVFVKFNKVAIWHRL